MEENPFLKSTDMEVVSAIILEQSIEIKLKLIEFAKSSTTLHSFYSILRLI